MKITYETEKINNVNGTSCNIDINAVAKTDDGATVILERTLTYNVNTANEGWREDAIAELKKQALVFESDATALTTTLTTTANISADLATAMKP